ncbi:hypothetical protein EV652_12180 [Kribbella steppae]|uniref:Uncharacterized protein n=1 Tax=Kribbella steppae TaxID=2512223 RepID=A0A4R2GXE9_9ACTN|nr:hypothetical protein EV652_12180 [Kribbella steppae]
MVPGADRGRRHDPGRREPDGHLPGHRRATHAAGRAGDSPGGAPANQLTPGEQAHVLAVLNGAEFIDRTPVQVYAVLLERGQYLCSVSTMYRILAANAQVKDRRRLARHPARARPERIATGPGQVFTWDNTLCCPVRPRASTTTPTS